MPPRARTLGCYSPPRYSPLLYVVHPTWPLAPPLHGGHSRRNGVVTEMPQSRTTYAYTTNGAGCLRVCVFKEIHLNAASSCSLSNGSFQRSPTRQPGGLRWVLCFILSASWAAATIRSMPSGPRVCNLFQCPSIRLASRLSALISYQHLVRAVAGSTSAVRFPLKSIVIGRQPYSS